MGNEYEGGDYFGLLMTLEQVLGGAQPLLENAHSREKDALEDALARLRHAGDDVLAWELRERVVSGGWNGEEAAIRCRYGHYELPIARILPAYLVALAQAGRLNDALFRRAATLIPRLLNFIPYSGPPVRWLERELDAEQVAQLQPFTRRLIEDVAAQALDEPGAEIIVAASQGYSNAVGAHLEGASFLVSAAREHAAHGLGGLNMANSYRREPIYRAVLEMARGARPFPDDDLAALTTELRRYPLKSLQALMPVTHPALRRVLLEALGWAEAGPLAALLGAGGDSAYGQIESVGNSPEPDNGMVDVAAARRALAQAGDERARQVFKLFRQAQCGLGNELFLLEAVQGLNRETVLKGKARRQQLSVKAFGLLPLENGAEEALERYVWLRRFEKESSRYGAGRQASERAAVRAALHNLAQVAGFGDAQRLEWQMEKRLGSEQLTPGRKWKVDDYDVVLALQGDSPALVVSRGEKQLRSVPAAVRRHADYETMKEAV